MKTIKITNDSASPVFIRLHSEITASRVLILLASDAIAAGFKVWTRVRGNYVTSITTNEPYRAEITEDDQE